MKKIVKLTETELTKVIKRMVNEQLSDRTGELYSRINELIDREFDDLEPSEIARILGNILKHHESHAYRKKHNIQPISRDEVIKNFNRHNK